MIRIYLITNKREKIISSVDSERLYIWQLYLNSLDIVLILERQPLDATKPASGKSHDMHSVCKIS